MSKGKRRSSTGPVRSEDIHPAATESTSVAPATRLDLDIQTGRDPERVDSDSHSAIAAFDAGRSRNRLQFHLVQAWFYENHRSAARRILGSLGRTVRNLVPAAERRDLQKTVTLPIAELLERMDSEAHQDTYEDWLGEFVDSSLTDADFRRALAPVFEALAAVQRTIVGKLDGLGRLVFELGELLDRGLCPADVHRHLGRPRQVKDRTTPTSGPANRLRVLKRGMQIHSHYEYQPEAEWCWDSFKPGELPPDSHWDDEVRQLLIELAISLGLPSDTLLLVQEECEQPTMNLIDRITQATMNALNAFHSQKQCGEAVQVDLNDSVPDHPIAPQAVVPISSVTDVIATNPDVVVPTDDEGATVAGVAGSPDPSSNSPRFVFDKERRIVVFDGNESLPLDPRIFRIFQQIYSATCEGRRITSKEWGKVRYDRLLRKLLPPALYGLIDSRPGKGGGYILNYPPRKPQ